MATNSSLSFRRRAALSFAVAPLLFAACGGSSLGPAGGANTASWCDFVVESDVLNDISLTSSGVEAEIEQLEAFVKRLPGEAPGEIKDAAKKLAEGTQLLVDAVRDADFKVLDADLGFQQDTEREAELDEASDKLDVFTQRECGRSFSGDDVADASDDSSDDVSGDVVPAADDDDTDDTGDFNPAGGTIREQMVAQLSSIGLTEAEATCIADNLDFTDPAAASGDVAAMLGFFEQCGIDLARLADLGGG